MFPSKKTVLANLHCSREFATNIPVFSAMSWLLCILRRCGHIYQKCPQICIFIVAQNNHSAGVIRFWPWISILLNSVFLDFASIFVALLQKNRENEHVWYYFDEKNVNSPKLRKIPTFGRFGTSLLFLFWRENWETEKKKILELKLQIFGQLLWN